MIKIKKNILVLLAICFFSFLIFWPVFTKNLYPFPGNYLIAWFQPWRTDTVVNGTLTISHKPIAQDNFRITYPFKTLAFEITKNGNFPLWNPYNGAGMPLLATMGGFFDPLYSFFLFLPFYKAWSFGIILQSLLIGIFTYIYCKILGFNRLISLLSTAIFLFSGYVIVKLSLGTFGTAIATLPFLLFIIESYARNRNSKIIYLLPIGIFISLISTIPQISFYIIAFSYFYAMFRLRDASEKIRSILFLSSLFFVGMLLSAFQLVPTLELYKQANITNQSSAFIFDRFLLPFNHFLTLAIPNYFGNPSTYNYFGRTDYLETAVYIGLIPIFLCFIAFLTKKNEKTLIPHFYFITIILSFLLTIDWGFTRLLYAFPIPIIGTGVPERIFLLTVFSLAILSGYGMKYLSEANVKKFLNPIIGFLIIVGIITIVTIGMYVIKFPCPEGPIKNCRTVSLRNTLLENSAFALFFVSLYTLSFIGKRKKTFNRLLLTTTILVVCFIGAFNTYKYFPFSPQNTFLPPHPLFKILQKDNSTFERFFGIGEATIPTDFATYYRIYDPQYYDPLYIKRFGELVGYANSGKLEKVLPRSDVEIANDFSLENKDTFLRRNLLLNLLSVKYLIFNRNEVENLNKKDSIWNNNNWTVQKNSNVLPHVYIADKFEVIKDRKDILKRLFDSSFDYRNTAIVEENLPLANNNIKTDKIVDIKQYKENEVVLQTLTKNSSLLVLTDNYYPGWKAYVDNKETKIFRANYTFRAIVIPEGSHVIKFSYEPASLKIGLLISGVSLSIYLLLLFTKKFIQKPNYSGQKYAQINTTER